MATVVEEVAYEYEGSAEREAFRVTSAGGGEFVSSAGLGGGQTSRFFMVFSLRYSEKERRCLV